MLVTQLGQGISNLAELLPLNSFFFSTFAVRCFPEIPPLRAKIISSKGGQRKSSKIPQKPAPLPCRPCTCAMFHRAARRTAVSQRLKIWALTLKLHCQQSTGATPDNPLEENEVFVDSLKYVFLGKVNKEGLFCCNVAPGHAVSSKQMDGRE